MASNPIELHIHYDTQDHFIAMSDFLVASKSVEKIIEDINRQILGGALKYKLVVIPPQEGTFLKTVGIIAVTVTVNSTVLPITQDYVLGAFEGLTQHKPAHYGQQHFQALKDLAVGFFSKEVEELEKCIPQRLNLDRAFKAKSDFYISCQNNEKVTGLGFDQSKDFPIRKNQFARHISKDRIRSVDSDFFVYEAVLVSPVTVNKDIKWELQDITTGTKISAYMRDDSFKNGFLNGKHPVKETKENDVLKILVEYKKQERNGEVEVKEICIDTVYSFNRTEIVPVPANLPTGAKFQRSEDLPMDKIWGTA